MGTSTGRQAKQSRTLLWTCDIFICPYLLQSCLLEYVCLSFDRSSKALMASSTDIRSRASTIEEFRDRILLFLASSCNKIKIMTWQVLTSIFPGFMAAHYITDLSSSAVSWVVRAEGLFVRLWVIGRRCTTVKMIDLDRISFIISMSFWRIRRLEYPRMPPLSNNWY